MQKIFFYLHLTGLVFILIGLYLLLIHPTAYSTIEGMGWIVLALGLGGVMVSPYPVVKAIQWMQKQS